MPPLSPENRENPSPNLRNPIELTHFLLDYIGAKDPAFCRTLTSTITQYWLSQHGRTLLDQKRYMDEQKQSGLREYIEYLHGIIGYYCIRILPDNLYQTLHQQDSSQNEAIAKDLYQRFRNFPDLTQLITQIFERANNVNRQIAHNHQKILQLFNPQTDLPILPIPSGAKSAYNIYPPNQSDFPFASAGFSIADYPALGLAPADSADLMHELKLVTLPHFGRHQWDLFKTGLKAQKKNPAFKKLLQHFGKTHLRTFEWQNFVLNDDLQWKRTADPREADEYHPIPTGRAMLIHFLKVLNEHHQTMQINERQGSTSSDFDETEIRDLLADLFESALPSPSSAEHHAFFQFLNKTSFNHSDYNEPFQRSQFEKALTLLEKADPKYALLATYLSQPLSVSQAVRDDKICFTCEIQGPVSGYASQDNHGYTTAYRENIHMYLEYHPTPPQSIEIIIPNLVTSFSRPDFLSNKKMPEIISKFPRWRLHVQENPNEPDSYLVLEQPARFSRVLTQITQSIKELLGKKDSALLDNQTFPFYAQIVQKELMYLLRQAYVEATLQTHQPSQCFDARTALSLSDTFKNSLPFTQYDNSPVTMPPPKTDIPHLQNPIAGYNQNPSYLASFQSTASSRNSLLQGLRIGKHEKTDIAYPLGNILSEGVGKQITSDSTLDTSVFYHFQSCSLRHVADQLATFEDPALNRFLKNLIEVKKHEISPRDAVTADLAETVNRYDQLCGKDFVDLPFHYYALIHSFVLANGPVFPDWLQASINEQDPYALKLIDKLNNFRRREEQNIRGNRTPYFMNKWEHLYAQNKLAEMVAQPNQSILEILLPSNFLHNHDPKAFDKHNKVAKMDQKKDIKTRRTAMTKYSKLPYPKPLKKSTPLAAVSPISPLKKRPPQEKLTIDALLFYRLVFDRFEQDQCHADFCRLFIAEHPDYLKECFQNPQWAVNFLAMFVQKYRNLSPPLNQDLVSAIFEFIQNEILELYQENPAQHGLLWFYLDALGVLKTVSGRLADYSYSDLERFFGWQLYGNPDVETKLMDFIRTVFRDHRQSQLMYAESELLDDMGMGNHATLPVCYQ